MNIKQIEFVSLMALLMSLAALAIDAMLPAHPIIGNDLHVTSSNGTQLIIVSLFIGLSIGQMFYGPLSDTLGRKPLIYIGVSIFLIGNLISIYAHTFEIMLFGRFLQGLGISSPRVITLAIVRDQFSGNQMAKIMSLITMVFVIVPALAPSMGQVILYFYSWRMIFWFFILLSTFALIWFYFRQEETLAPENRRKFNTQQFIYATKRIFTTPVAIGYTVASGLIFGSFVGYLVSSQQIFQELYKLGDKFPLFFGILAIAIGTSSFLNSYFVEKIGMAKITFFATIGILALSLIFTLFLLINSGESSFVLFMFYMILSFGCIGFLFGNYNSLAMEPLGDIAGSATAVISTIQSIISISMGSFIASLFNQTLYPLVIGFLVASFLSLITIFIIKAKTK